MDIKTSLKIILLIYESNRYWIKLDLVDNCVMKKIQQILVLITLKRCKNLSKSLNNQSKALLEITIYKKYFKNINVVSILLLLLTLFHLEGQENFQIKCYWHI